MHVVVLFSCILSGDNMVVSQLFNLNLHGVFPPTVSAKTHKPFKLSCAM